LIVPALNRRLVLRTALAGCAGLALPSARACEFFASSLRVYHPWTRETDELDDHAVVCMKFDEVSQSDRLIGVQTPVASGCELVGPQGVGPVNLAIPIGQELELRETDTHLRLVGLQQLLLQGRAYPLTLHFERGGRLETLLSVDFTRARRAG
jgi:copper(I)-binding protein